MYSKLMHAINFDIQYFHMCVGMILQSAATHTSSDNKRCVKLRWIAPFIGTGCIRFRLVEL